MLDQEPRSTARVLNFFAYQEREPSVPFVHLSTDYVYDGSGERPWQEDDVTGPLSVYGASKLAGEDAIRAAHAPHLIIGTSWVYAAQGTNSCLRLRVSRASGLSCALSPTRLVPLPRPG